MSIPAFDADGLLPPGDHPATLPELRASFLVTGEGVDSATWDAAWRGHLVDNLEALVGQLWRAGTEAIFVGGSFVEAKGHPGDVDGYFECEKRTYPRLVETLNAGLADPIWDTRRRRVDPSTGEKRILMWHLHRVELFPHFTDQPAGSVIRDEDGSARAFPLAFRQSRRFRAAGILKAKGVVRLVR